MLFPLDIPELRTRKPLEFVDMAACSNSTQYLYFHVFWATIVALNSTLTACHLVCRFESTYTRPRGKEPVGEESARYGQRRARTKRRRRAHSCLRDFRECHTLSPAKLCHLTLAGRFARLRQPQQTIPQMTKGGAVCESMRTGRKNH